MKTAVVTGANRGIGLELTRQLLDSGYYVHATYRSNKGGLTQIDSGNLSTHQMDVRDKMQISNLVQSVEKIDLLINNAGVADGRWQSISEIDMEHALEVLNVNALSPVLVTQQSLPKLKEDSRL